MIRKYNYILKKIFALQKEAPCLLHVRMFLIYE